MKNFLFRPILFIGGLGLFLFFTSCNTEQKERVFPNIIFLLTDDQRADMLGAAGNQIIQTPNLDRLAQNGLFFSNTYVTTSICSVSRASILSGQYGRRHGLWGFGQGFSPEAFSDTYPMVLKRMGYVTGFVGKYGVGPTQMPKDSFDYWAGFDHQGTYHHRDEKGNYLHLTKKIEGQAIDFIQQRNSDTPFLLSVCFKAPHVQDGAPPFPEKLFPFDSAYIQEYEGVIWEKSVATGSEYFDHFPPIFTKGNEGRKRWKVRFSTKEKYDASLEGYYRLLHGVDVAVGNILQALNQQGLSENTIIIFSSDNGFYLGEYGFAGKWYGSEPSVRVPLVIYDPRPGATGGKRIEKLALNIDIAPTILKFAGAKIPSRMQGRDLSELWNSEDSETWRQDFMYEHLWPSGTPYHIPSTEGVITMTDKYMQYFNGYTADTILFEEMYTLSNDPNELKNLATDNEQKSRKLDLQEKLSQYKLSTK